MIMREEQQSIKHRINMSNKSSHHNHKKTEIHTLLSIMDIITTASLHVIHYFFIITFSKRKKYIQFCIFERGGDLSGMMAKNTYINHAT